MTHTNLRACLSCKREKLVAEFRDRWGTVRAKCNDCRAATDRAPYGLRGGDMNGGRDMSDKTPSDALYEKMCALDNQDVALEQWPSELIDALDRAGFCVVPKAGEGMEIET